MRLVRMLISTLTQRATLSLLTVPKASVWLDVIGITAATTAVAGVTAVSTNFIRFQDYNPPSSLWKPFSAFIFPSLVEETFWRGALLPPTATFGTTAIVLGMHVLFHPLAGSTIWPRGKDVFCDPRFLLLCTIVLGGATISFLVSGGSAWAAA